MHILLLPPTLPPHRPLSPDAPRVALTPGQRVTATVLSPDLEGRSMIAFAGRELASQTPLPFAPGARVLLEVVAMDGDVPQLRVVVPDASPPSAPVASATYAYAAAVLAARDGPPLSAAAAALARWLPALVARGLLTAQQASALGADVGRLIVREPAAPAGAPVTPTLPSAATLAQALEHRVAHDSAGLEARIAAVLGRHDAPDADQVIGADVRGRLAGLLARLAARLPGAATAADAGELAAAQHDVQHVQEALLAEQARLAAHVARDGVLSLRIPLTLGQQDVDVLFRVHEERADSDGDTESPAAAVQHLRLDLELPTLGRVQARLSVHGQDVRVELLTAQGVAADALEEGLARLTAALTGAGFHEVLTRVAIDPVRVAAGEPPLDLPPEGSIVNTDA